MNGTDPSTRPRPWVTTKSRLIVLLLVVLMVSSGSIYYFDTPIFYYGYLAFTVLTIIVVVYIVIHFTQSPPELFPTTNGESEKESTNPGLERVLKAEQKFNRKMRKTQKDSMEFRNKAFKGEPISDATDSDLMAKRERRKRGRGISRGSLKKARIGSIPVEESIWMEKTKLSKKDTEEETTSKPEKVTTFLCPSCGSKELYYEAGLISGYKYHCKDCDYIGSFIIEKDFKVVS